MHIQNIASSSSSFKSSDRAAIKTIARHLYGAKQRCGPRAKLSDRLHYHGVTYDLPPGLAGARVLYERLGPIPLGSSLDRINPRGPYSLDNLRYANAAAQTANRVLRKRTVWASPLRADVAPEGIQATSKLGKGAP